METQALISVIIPIYNMEKYLPRCMDSICSNTYKKLEIICINDGSKDTTLKILKQYQAKDDRVIIIDQENRKVSASRNAGLDIARGEWIAFIDPDDWVHPQYFEILYYIAVKNEADISICDSITTRDEPSSDSLIDLKEVGYKLITKNQLNHLHIARSRVWGKLYRKSTIGNLRFISGAEPVEDNCFNTTLYSEQMKYVMTDLKLYYYYIREDSAVHTNTGRQSLVYVQCMIPIISKETDPEKRQDMIKRCYNILLSSRYLEMFSNDYKEVRKKINFWFNQLNRYIKFLSFKDQVIYSVLRLNPQLYRLWRINDDPTLLSFEKSLKNKNSNSL